MITRTQLIKKWFYFPKKFKLAILLGTAVVLTGAYLVLFFIPEYNTWSEKKSQLDQLTATLNDNKRVASRLSTFEEEVASLEIEITRAKELLPVSPSIDELIRQLYLLAVKSGIRFSIIELKPEVPGNFYMQIPLSLTMKGSYNHFLVFFDSLSKMDRILNVKNIALKKDKMENEEVTLNLTAEAVTYRLMTEQEFADYQNSLANGKKGSGRLASDGNVISDTFNPDSANDSSSAKKRVR